MSIPNRFIDSFSVGTCIVTDNLKIKWYMPFTCEVVEIGDIGYHKIDEINWNEIYKRLDTLDNPECLKIINKFNTTWSPDSFVEYILNQFNE
jgi:c-di-AMP phosphodiesterase-like protein